MVVVGEGLACDMAIVDGFDRHRSRRNLVACSNQSLVLEVASRVAESVPIAGVVEVDVQELCRCLDGGCGLLRGPPSRLQPGRHTSWRCVGRGRQVSDRDATCRES